MAKVFIAVAWPYADGVIHVGQVSGVYLPADIFARYQRMRGNEVLMVSGSDMHGTPISVKAEEEGIPPAEYAAHYHALLAKAMADLGISFDLYDNTESAVHKEVVKEVFLQLYRKGDIYEAEMLLPYCEVEQRYLPDRYVEGECPHCHFPNARGDQCDNCGRLLDPQDLINPRDRKGHRPVMRTRKHLFFRLTAFEAPLREWLKDKDYWKPNVINFTNNWLAQGLRDRAVTRDLAWGIGIPLPGFDDRKIYVWFEAFMGYYTMAIQWARGRGEPEAWRRFWQDPECRHYYFLGKDNIPFHTVWWPAVLMAIGGLNLPYDVPANEFMTLESLPFSKSRGRVIPADEALTQYPLDTWRYVLAANMPETRDSDFTYDDLVTRNNSELVATYGNFVHRALTFTVKNFGEVPPAKHLDARDKAALRAIEEHWNRVGQNLQYTHFRDALKEAMALARFGNQYFDAKAPWSLVKTDREACGTALHISLRIAKALAILMAPFLPTSSQELWGMLGYRDQVHQRPWEEALEDIPGGQPLGTPKTLFRQVELPGPPAPEVDALDLRVGRVVGVLPHPNADKLYLMDVDIGGEVRRIVSGLRENYRAEELQGRSIVVLCNLQPARLRGEESKGMLLAAVKGDVVRILLAPTGARPGSQILGQAGAPMISHEDFRKFQIRVGPGGVPVMRERGGAKPLEVDGLPITVDQGMEEGAEVT